MLKGRVERNTMKQVQKLAMFMILLVLSMPFVFGNLTGGPEFGDGNDFDFRDRPQQTLQEYEEQLPQGAPAVSEVGDAGQQCIEKNEETSAIVDAIGGDTLSTIVMVIRIVKGICKVLSMIDMVLNALNAIMGGDSPATCCVISIIPGVGTGICKAINSLYVSWKSIYLPVGGGFCCIINCNWCRGQNCLKGFTEDADQFRVDPDENQQSKFEGAGGLESDRTVMVLGGGISINKLEFDPLSNLMAGVDANPLIQSDAGLLDGVGGFYDIMGQLGFDPYESIYVSAICLCIPGILFNLEKLQMIYKTYNCCVEQACINGLSTEPCEKMLAEATCMYWEGSALNALLKIVMGIVTALVGSVIQELLKTVSIAWLPCILPLISLKDIPDMLSSLEDDFDTRTIDDITCDDLGFGPLGDSKKQAQSPSSRSTENVFARDGSGDGLIDGFGSSSGSVNPTGEDSNYIYSGVLFLDNNVMKYYSLETGIKNAEVEDLADRYIFIEDSGEYKQYDFTNSHVIYEDKTYLEKDGVKHDFSTDGRGNIVVEKTFSDGRVERDVLNAAIDPSLSGNLNEIAKKQSEKLIDYIQTVDGLYKQSDHIPPYYRKDFLGDLDSTGRIREVYSQEGINTKILESFTEAEGKYTRKFGDIDVVGTKTDGGQIEFKVGNTEVKPHILPDGEVLLIHGEKLLRPSDGSVISDEEGVFKIDRGRLTTDYNVEIKGEVLLVTEDSNSRGTAWVRDRHYVQTPGQPPQAVREEVFNLVRDNKELQDANKVSQLRNLPGDAQNLEFELDGISFEKDRKKYKAISVEGVNDQMLYQSEEEYFIRQKSDFETLTSLKANEKPITNQKLAKNYLYMMNTFNKEMTDLEVDSEKVSFVTGGSVWRKDERSSGRQALGDIRLIFDSDRASAEKVTRDGDNIIIERGTIEDEKFNPSDNKHRVVMNSQTRKINEITFTNSEVGNVEIFIDDSGDAYSIKIGENYITEDDDFAEKLKEYESEISPVKEHNERALSTDEISAQRDAYRIALASAVDSATQQVSYMLASFLISETLGQWGQEWIEDYCREEYEASEPMNTEPQKITSRGPSADPDTGKCLGERTTIKTAQILEKYKYTNNFYKYDYMYLITACESEVDFNVSLQYCDPLIADECIDFICERDPITNETIVEDCEDSICQPNDLCNKHILVTGKVLLGHDKGEDLTANLPGNYNEICIDTDKTNKLCIPFDGSMGQINETYGNETETIEINETCQDEFNVQVTHEGRNYRWLYESRPCEPLTYAVAFANNQEYDSTSIIDNNFGYKTNSGVFQSDNTYTEICQISADFKICKDFNNNLVGIGDGTGTQTTGAMRLDKDITKTENNGIFIYDISYRIIPSGTTTIHTYLIGGDYVMDLERNKIISETHNYDETKSGDDYNLFCIDSSDKSFGDDGLLCEEI